MAEKLFSGRNREEVKTLIPMLYSLCAQAQTVAASLALNGGAPNRAALQRVALEAVREHGLYLSRWFPALRQAMQGIAGWHSLTNDELKRKLDDLRGSIEGSPDFFEAAKNAARQLPERVRKSAPADMPGLHQADFSPAILEYMANEQDWCQQPAVEGVRENSFYSRAVTYEHFPPDTTGRMAARLWDFFQWLDVAQAGKAAFPLWGQHDDGMWQLGWVETARGRLYHAAHVTGNKVMAYRISAPTEWNFHPQGVLAQWLEQFPKADEGTVAELAQLVDPCVAVRIEAAGHA